MKILAREIVLEPLERLTPHPRNPRQGNVAAIQRSIRANGYFAPVVAQRSTGHILAGNHRYEAARRARAKEIPVVWVDVDDAHALRILLADNRANDVADYDEKALVGVLQEVLGGSGSLEGTGYDQDALDELLEGLGMGNGASEDGEGEGAGAPPQEHLCLVTCETEDALAALFEELSGRGYTCKLIT